MASLKLFVFFAVCIAVVCAAQVDFAKRDGYAAAKGHGYAKGQVKIQVYRGPNKAYGKDVKGYGYDDGAFAPHGHYFTQPEDEKGYGY